MTDKSTHPAAGNFMGKYPGGRKTLRSPAKPEYWWTFSFSTATVPGLKGYGGKQ
ncbi:hypothetical protein PMI16_00560 [Herbaspirillum sp. CF444]|nr:hypothetical protein PMI16_00560 [Herbaspirillum sp. CF444]